MAQRHKSWIAFFIKVIMILILGQLWISDSFGADRIAESETDYYWVGGTGNWSDLSHWATTSGGSEKHEVLPNQYSNVHFDENSFTGANQEVILDNSEAFCRDMIWTGSTNSPTFRSSNSPDLFRVRVHGSLTLIEDMDLQSTNIRFILQALSGEHYLTSSGNSFHEGIYFDGEVCTYSIQDSLSGGYVGFYKGKTITNGQSISAKKIYVQNELFLGSSNVEFHEYFISYAPTDYGTSKIIGRTLNPGDSLTLQAEGSYKQNLHKIELFAPARVDIFKDSVKEMICHERVMLRRFDHIDNLRLYDDAIFDQLNSASVDTLIMSPGMSYRFNLRNSIRIDSLKAIGTCGEPITIDSYYRGSQGNSVTTFRKETGSVHIEYVNLRNVHAEGGATFTGENVVAIGDVTGWSLTSPAPRKLYWVGESGDWYDNQHWSLVSGGSGGECIPSVIDDAIFDQNSFSQPGQTVYSDGDILVHDMDWSKVTNQPLFKVDVENTVHVHGSIILSQNMTFENKRNTIIFLADQSTETINSGGHNLGKNVYFNGNESEWHLTDSLATDREITINNGRLFTNDKNINTANLTVRGSGSLMMGGSDIRLSESFVGFSFYDAGTSNIYISDKDWYYENQSFSVGTIFPMYNLNNVYFTGKKGVFVTDGLEPHSSNTVYNNSFTLNNLVFYENAELQNRRTTIIANKIEIFGDTKAYGKYFLDSLLLGQGSVNELDTSYFEIDRLSVDGSCSSSTEVNGGSFELSALTTVNYCILDGVMVSESNSITALNSIDRGNNTGITFSDSDTPDLYWVGGSGAWSDQSHWSTVSGGPGGSCVPTIATNVHFDSNSFTAEGQEVTIDVERANFKDMNWTGARFNPTLSGDTTTMMRCYGSFILATNMSYEYEGKSIEFMSSQPAETIATNNNQLLCDLHFSEIKGEWHLNDNLDIDGILWLNSGVFDTKDHDIKVETILTDYVYPYSIQSKSVLKLNNSIVTIRGHETQYYHVSLNERVEAGNSTILIPKGGDISTRSNLHNVIYSDIGTDTRLSSFRIQDEEVSKSFNNITFMSSGYIQMGVNLPPADQNFNKVTFLGNGDINVRGKFIFDSLIFSAGTNNRFLHSPDIHINKLLDLRGTSCAPILLSNNYDEETFSITVPNGTLYAKYVKLKGVQISGSNTFYAGEGSEDLGRNDGWVFETNPEYAGGFLGNDKTLSPGQTITLDATHYGSNISYLWNTGETTSKLEVVSCGDYSVQVSLGQGCIAYDTISISSSEIGEVQLVASIANARCEEDGQVELDQELVNTTLDGYAFHLINEDSTYGIKILNGNHIFYNVPIGSYSLIIDDEKGCLNTISTEIIIDQENSLLPENFIVGTQDATCAQKGEITIDQFAIDHVAAPYSITLTSAFSGNELILGDSDSVFENLTEDTYILTVIDFAGCVYEYSNDIIIHLDESNCRSSVMSPDFGETLIVPFDGKVSIYNRNGGLVRTLDAPGEWDGTDNRGQTVPIGIYILIADENRDQIIQVTVVR